MAPKKKSSRVRWARLNPDLLRIISKKLCDISSFICFRAVCKRWRAATSLSDPPRQFPCVIDWPKGKGKLDDTLRVYSISSRRTHTFQVPDAHFHGPSDGYVLLYERYRSAKERQSFLNPFAWKEWLFLLDVPVDIVEPIRLGRNLIRNDGPALLYKEYEHYFLCFWQSEKNDWTEIRVPSIKTVALYDHKFFFAEWGHLHQRVGVIDETTGVLLSYFPPPINNFYHGYLIATDDGLLAVEVIKSIAVIPYLLIDLEKCQFLVYRLENYPRNPQWTKLSGIGDLMLFLDQQNGFSLKASDFGGFKGNCIYFITAGKKWAKPGSENVIARFDIESNKTKRIPAPAWLGLRQWERQAAWFIPTLN
ncbi:F-box family protein [Rhynchospora pubera]|uniref:F-box domain-containing protein n=1 Tax=Rhynchospora pubera TaxID=906938 RepID=A0AAV8BV49_9POAL|nr:F-box domain-containing protein [Rhynchospora pubera]KAJ4747065.1 F-box family protein [Rhynchospora pubera]